MVKNEYQQEAYALLDKMIGPHTQDFETDYHTDDGYSRKAVFRMCSINGVKYIKLSSVHYNLPSMLTTLYKKGYISGDNIRYFLDKSRIAVYVELMPLVIHKQEIAGLFDSGYGEDYKVIPVIDAAKDLKVKDTHIETSLLIESQKAYERRKELLRKSKEYKDDLRHERDREQEANREVRLKELVREIESMGWKVTLTLKNG